MPHIKIETIQPTSLPGVTTFSVDRRTDNRGAFMEIHNAYQNPLLSKHMRISAMQVNISENYKRGVTRGIHAEPWAKKIVLVAGQVFVAIVDLRSPRGVLAVYTTILNPGDGIFLPRGVGNSYQALENNTYYAYAVNGRYREGVVFPALHCHSPELAIPWPIPAKKQNLSEKDQLNPTVEEYLTALRDKKSRAARSKA